MVRPFNGTDAATGSGVEARGDAGRITDAGTDISISMDVTGIDVVAPVDVALVDIVTPADPVSDAVLPAED